MFRRVLALAMPVAVALIAHYDASAQTGARSDERSGKEVMEAVCAESHATGLKDAPGLANVLTGALALVTDLVTL